MDSALALARRLTRPVVLAVSLLVLAFAAAVWQARLGLFVPRGLVGVDFSLISELGRRWAEDGSQYAPWQLAAPYPYDAGSGGTDVSLMPSLYPPYAGPLFAVARFLPPILWWAP